MTDSVLTYESFLADMRKAMLKLDTIDVPKLLPGEYENYYSRPSAHNFCGMRVINSPFIKPEHVGDYIDAIPVSKNRSKRIFKKLCKRRRDNCKPILVDIAYVFNGDIVASPKIVTQLNSLYKIEL